MDSRLAFDYLSLNLILCQLYIQTERAPGSLVNTSGIQLLGLFPDWSNASHSQTPLLSVPARSMFKATILLSQQSNITIEVISTCGVVGTVNLAFPRETRIIAPLTNRIGIPTISMLQLILNYPTNICSLLFIERFFQVEQLHLPLPNYPFDIIGPHMSLSIKTMSSTHMVQMQSAMYLTKSVWQQCEPDTFPEAT